MYGTKSPAGTSGTLASDAAFAGRTSTVHHDGEPSGHGSTGGVHAARTAEAAATSADVAAVRKVIGFASIARWLDGSPSDQASRPGSCSVPSMPNDMSGTPA